MVVVCLVFVFWFGLGLGWGVLFLIVYTDVFCLCSEVLWLLLLMVVGGFVGFDGCWLLVL